MRYGDVPDCISEWKISDLITKMAFIISNLIADGHDVLSDNYN